MNVNLVELENRIEYIKQESTACRSEVCRSLESEADELSMQVESARIAGKISPQKERVLSEKLQDAYRHFGAELRI